MPRIDAPTVAEHHRMRRDSLLEAGLDILATKGPAGLSHSTLGAVVGIARTSVYQYFPSRDALLEAVIDHAFASTRSHLTAAGKHTSSATERIATYVAHSVARASDAVHSVFASIPGDQLSSAHQRQLDELHHAALAPLLDALTELRVADPALSASLIEAMVQAASRRIIAGEDSATVTSATVFAVVHGPLALP